MLFSRPTRVRGGRVSTTIVPQRGRSLYRSVPMTAIPLSQLATSRRWQNNFLKVLPAVQEHAAISFRRLRPEAKDEATAETIARACVNYANLARQKKLY